MNHLLKELAPLELARHWNLNRAIGISVSAPMTNLGADPAGARQFVEIDRETPIANTQTFVRIAVPVEGWQKEACEMIDETVGDIDRIVNELAQHRVRLLAAKRELLK